MGNIKLAGAAWSFVGTTLLESANIWRALGIKSIDLFAVPGAPLDSEEIEQNDKYCQEMNFDFNFTLKQQNNFGIKKLNDIKLSLIESN